MMFMAILVMDDRLFNPVFFAAVARGTKFRVRSFFVGQLVVDFKATASHVFGIKSACI